MTVGTRVRLLCSSALPSLPFVVAARLTAHPPRLPTPRVPPILPLIHCTPDTPRTRKTSGLKEDGTEDKRTRSDHGFGGDRGEFEP